MSESPILVSVLLPVYNGEKYLRQAIKSILSQTLANFELIIINDGSDDNTADILSSYSDCRIKIIKNENNLGLVSSLNIGLDLAQGKYLARMDADDISLPDRLKQQFDFMEKNPAVGVCGTAIRLLSDGCFKRSVINPSEDAEIKASFLFFNAIAHPSVMIRREIYKNFQYSSDFRCVEDYEFWIRISDKTKFHNINKVLLEYRSHSSQKSLLDNNQEKRSEVIKIINLYFAKLKWKDDALLSDYNNIFEPPCSSEDLEAIKLILRRILNLNNSQPCFGNKILEKVVARIWVNIFLGMPSTIRADSYNIFCNFNKDLRAGILKDITIFSRLKILSAALENNTATKKVVKFLFWAKSFISQKIYSNKFINTSLAKTENFNCHLNLTNKEILDIVSVAFNNDSVINYQIALIKKNILDNYSYTVIDNSSDSQQRKKIAALCHHFNIPYISLPYNPFLGSMSHGLALNWALKNYINLRQAKFFGFIDHDIFPAKPIKLIPTLRKQGVYGPREGKDKWYLWPGLCFFDANLFRGKKFNFMPQTGVSDTGGRNYFSIFRYLDEKNISFPICRMEKIRNGDVAQGDYICYQDDWLHTFNASRWMNIENPEKKDLIINDLLNSLIIN